VRVIGWLMLSQWYGFSSSHDCMLLVTPCRNIIYHFSLENEAAYISVEFHLFEIGSGPTIINTKLLLFWHFASYVY
jgi:hypothetical protein